ncbi:MAG: YidH family protein [Polyangiaceae bacterium]
MSPDRSPARGAADHAASEPHEETLRVHNANERTWLAWIRTGVALMAFGFGITRLAGPGVASARVGDSLIALGALVNPFATVRYAQIRRAVERGERGAPGVSLVYAFGTATTFVGIAMWLLFATAGPAAP